VYLRELAEREMVRVAARQLIARIDSASDWLARHARFDDARQQQRMLQLFADGRSTYAALVD
jgi:hypothetical protein